MNCSKCGKQLENNNSLICVYCGSNPNVQEEDGIQNGTNKVSSVDKKPALIYRILAWILIIGFCFFILRNCFNKSININAHMSQTAQDDSSNVGTIISTTEDNIDILFGKWIGYTPDNVEFVELTFAKGKDATHISVIMKCGGKTWKCEGVVNSFTNKNIEISWKGKQGAVEAKQDGKTFKATEYFSIESNYGVMDGKYLNCRIWMGLGADNMEPINYSYDIHMQKQ